MTINGANQGCAADHSRILWIRFLGWFSAGVASGFSLRGLHIAGAIKFVAIAAIASQWSVVIWSKLKGRIIEGNET